MMWAAVLDLLKAWSGCFVSFYQAALGETDSETLIGWMCQCGATLLGTGFLVCVLYHGAVRLRKYWLPCGLVFGVLAVIGLVLL